MNAIVSAGSSWAVELNTTRVPSSEIAGSSEGPFPPAPPAPLARLTSSVVFVCVSRT